MKNEKGYFILTMDTEMGWGLFQHDRFRRARFSADGSLERMSLVRLLDIMDEFDISATWAVVGHLLYNSCEHCVVCPIKDWKGKYESFEEVYDTNNPLWYGADVIKTLLERGTRHEIAFHGYTHSTFNEKMMNEERARIELQESSRLFARKGIIPRTVIFPRNEIGHLGLFKEFGFLCYRGRIPKPAMFSLSYARRILSRLLPLLFTAQTYEYRDVRDSEMINVPASLNYFNHSRGLSRILYSINLHKLTMNTLIRAVKQAAIKKRIIHLWAHPHQFITEKDFEMISYLLTCVAKYIEQGDLISITMSGLAKQLCASTDDSR